MTKYIQKVFLIFVILLMLPVYSGCDLWILGSEHTGYKVIIETPTVGYEHTQKIEAILVENNYRYFDYTTDSGIKKKWKERPISVGARHKTEVCTGLYKTISINDKEEIVQIYLRYVTGTNNDVQNLLIEVENWWRGGIVPELKTEIDEAEHFISSILINEVGSEALHIKRFGEIVQN